MKSFENSKISILHIEVQMRLEQQQTQFEFSRIQNECMYIVVLSMTEIKTASGLLIIT